MYRDVGGVQCSDCIQRAAEAFHRIFRKTCDQIHVDGLEAGGNRFAVGPQHIGSLMGTAAGAQHMVFHGLGVDAHTVGTVFKNGAQLLFT